LGFFNSCQQKVGAVFHFLLIYTTGTFIILEILPVIFVRRLEVLKQSGNGASNATLLKISKAWQLLRFFIMKILRNILNHYIYGI